MKHCLIGIRKIDGTTQIVLKEIEHKHGTWYRLRKEKFPLCIVAWKITDKKSFCSKGHITNTFQRSLFLMFTHFLQS